MKNQKRPLQILTMEYSLFCYVQVLRYCWSASYNYLCQRQYKFIPTKYELWDTYVNAYRSAVLS